MAIDPESLGYETDHVDFEYGWRDTVTYALGVGAKPPGDLDFLYEGRGPAVLPTFATIPTFAVFDDLVDRIGCDRLGMVHHSQRLDVMGALPPSGRLRVVGKVAGLYDLRRLAMSEFAIEAHDKRGQLVVRGVVTLVLRNDGGFGGPRPPRSERIHLPDRAPDFEVEDAIPASQALLYRLNGDLNPLHADPEFASRAGFERPILHGLCTFGYAGRAVVHQACGGDPSKFGTIQGQFSAPVFPGDTLVTQGWNADDRVLLKVSTTHRPDEACLSQAYVDLRH
ncbi:MAG: MaoC/PaaZ C-terminal domain-containing protein [Myxococcota bacterium]